MLSCHGHEADCIILQANSQTQQAKLHVKVAQTARPRYPTKVTHQQIVNAVLAILGRMVGNARCVLQENIRQVWARGNVRPVDKAFPLRKQAHLRNLALRNAPRGSTGQMGVHVRSALLASIRVILAGKQ